MPTTVWALAVLGEAFCLCLQQEVWSASVTHRVISAATMSNSAHRSTRPDISLKAQAGSVATRPGPIHHVPTARSPRSRVSCRTRQFVRGVLDQTLEGHPP